MELFVAVLIGLVVIMLGWLAMKLVYRFVIRPVLSLVFFLLLCIFLMWMYFHFIHAPSVPARAMLTTLSG